jgi:hypothetical protein
MTTRTTSQLVLWMSYDRFRGCDSTKAFRLGQHCVATCNSQSLLSLHICLMCVFIRHGHDQVRVTNAIEVNYIVIPKAQRLRILTMVTSDS